MWRTALSKEGTSLLERSTLSVIGLCWSELHHMMKALALNLTAPEVRIVVMHFRCHSSHSLHEFVEISVHILGVFRALAWLLLEARNFSPCFQSASK